MSLDPHYTDAELVALYDAECGWSADRAYYAALPGETPCRVLDIGCGTGLIATTIAQAGHAVTGVDPAEAMLEVARNRAKGDTVRWVRGFAADVTGAFDLIYMTGHAFQALLTDTEITDLFRSVRGLLAPKGGFVFETRNPTVDWASRWDHSKIVKGPNGPVPLRRWVNENTGDHITFTTRYDLPGGPRDSVSTLRFCSLAELTSLAQACDLRVHQVNGDWKGGPFDPATSDEIICDLRH